MIKEAMVKIEEMTKPEIIEVSGRQYSSKTIHPVKDPLPETLAVHTLSGFLGYITENIDELEFSRLIIHVQSPDEVCLYSNLKGDFQQRASYIVSRNIFPKPKINVPVTVEEFIIQLQANFVRNDQTAALLKIVGNLQDGAVRTVTDDGFSQAVSVKAGITRLEETKVPNPVPLRPFRTFLEIEQPESQFVFRLQAGGVDKPPICALYEADGGKWKLDAIKGIEAWLKENISDVAIIA